MCHRNWSIDADLPADFAYLTIIHLKELFFLVQCYLESSKADEERVGFLNGIYATLSHLSLRNNQLRRHFGELKGVWGLATRNVFHHEKWQCVLRN